MLKIGWHLLLDCSSSQSAVLIIIKLVWHLIALLVEASRHTHTCTIANLVPPHNSIAFFAPYFASISYFYHCLLASWHFSFSVINVRDPPLICFHSPSSLISIASQCRIYTLLHFILLDGLSSSHNASLLDFCYPSFETQVFLFTSFPLFNWVSWLNLNKDHTEQYEIP